MASVLLVEDEPTARRAMARALREEPDLEVTTERTVDAGIAAVLRGAWDLIVCEEKLPDGRGLDVLGVACEAQPSAWLVLTSAHRDFDVALRAINDVKVDYFLAEPYAPRELVALVRRLLGETRAWPSS